MDKIGIVRTGFPGLGVSWQVFDEFIDSCGGSTVLSKLTTTEVCENFLKPRTADMKCSYCQLLLDQSASGGPSHSVGSATVFISHAWKYVFLDVVDCVRNHLRGHTSGRESAEYIWFDLFSNNQHDTSSVPFEWWCTTFQKAISSIGRTLLVLSPWQDPVVLTRYCSLLGWVARLIINFNYYLVLPLF